MFHSSFFKFFRNLRISRRASSYSRILTELVSSSTAILADFTMHVLTSALGTYTDFP